MLTRWCKVKLRKGEQGFSLLETIVALVLLGVIAAAFLSGLATTSTSRATADERVSAKILAESVMEQVKKLEYSSSSYEVAIPEEYPGYSADIEVETERNGDIQKITVVITHTGREVLTLESYKVDR